MHNCYNTVMLVTLCMYRRNLFQKPHNLIHLNLCIALLLGYVLFIGGADYARNISVSYCNIELKQTEILSASRKVLIHVSTAHEV